MTTPTPSDGSTIPKNYDELQKQYGVHISKLLLKYNKVERNQEDLHSHIWMKLMESKLLERFEDYVSRQTPKVLLAVECCDFLGISWGQWVTAMWAHHKGDPLTYAEDGKILSRRQGRWMPTPINLAEFQARGLVGFTSKSALFDFSDIVRLSIDERRTKSGELRGAFRLRGRKISSQGQVLSADRPEGLIKFPDIHITKAQFRNYLSRAILNHYANFCRTAERRHKERPYIPPGYATEDDSQSWESTLPDLQQCSADTVLALAEARQVLSDTLHECLDGVVSCKPVAEHEIEVFAMLENGSSLMQALRDTNLPPKVQNAVLDTIRPWAADFAL
jgi:hypothetical protein